MAAPNARRPRRSPQLAREVGARSSLDGAIDGATRLLEQLRALDFRGFEALPAEAAVRNMEAGPVPELTRALLAAIRLARSLPAVLGVATQDAGEPEALAEPEPASGVAATEGAAQPLRDRFAEDLDVVLRPQHGAGDAQAADPAPFVATQQRTVAALHAALEAVREARRARSKWALITAAEEGRRKAQKGLRAVFIMGVRLAAPRRAAALFPRERSELDTALQVRAALMEFRRDVAALLEGVAALGDVDVGLLMRDVRVRLLQLFGDASYHAVRAPDRFALQQLHARLSAWLDRAWNDFAAARALLAELGTLAAGLERVNQRQILREHDRAVRAEAVARLQTLSTQLTATSTSDGRRHLAGALREAQRMAWRDPALDALLDAELARPAATAAGRDADAEPGADADVARRADALRAALAAVPIEELAPPAG